MFIKQPVNKQIERKKKMDNSKQHNEQYYKLCQVLQIFPVSKSTWYRGIKTGLYPQPVKLNVRSVAWKASEIFALADNLQGKFV